MSRQSWLGWPNCVSLARIALVGPFVGCLFYLDDSTHPGVRHAAVGLFVVMALSDGLDGYLARRLKQETALGRVLDPLGDKLLITGAVIMLTLVGAPAGPGAGWYRLPIWVMAAVIFKDGLVLVGSTIIYGKALAPLLAPRAVGKACTAVEFLLILCVLLQPDLPVGTAWVRTALIGATLVLVAASSADYVRLGLQISAGQAGRRRQEKFRP